MDMKKDVPMLQYFCRIEQILFEKAAFDTVIPKTVGKTLYIPIKNEKQDTSTLLIKGLEAETSYQIYIYVINVLTGERQLVCNLDVMRETKKKGQVIIADFQPTDTKSVQIIDYKAQIGLFKINELFCGFEEDDLEEQIEDDTIVYEED